MICDLFSDLTVQAGVEFCEGELALSRLRLVHGLELSEALTDDLGAIAQTSGCPLFCFEQFNLLRFNLAHPLIKFHQLLHFEQVFMPFNLSFLLWTDALQLDRFCTNSFIEI